MKLYVNILFVLVIVLAIGVSLFVVTGLPLMTCMATSVITVTGSICPVSVLTLTAAVGLATVDTTKVEDVRITHIVEKVLREKGGGK